MLEQLLTEQKTTDQKPGSLLEKYKFNSRTKANAYKNTLDN
jgi:hypothetical protein